ncbi:MAG: DnaB-like helicase C-terminal domain-containing protein [Myxococcales bacterium]
MKDEADKHHDGTLPADPQADAKLVSAEVPRVLTERDILTASRKQAFSQEPVRSLTWTHSALDQITGGIRTPFHWVVAADTSWGKSSFLVAIADDNITAGKTVLIVSTEDTEELYGARFMIRRSGVNAYRYRDRKLTGEERARVLEVEQAGREVPVFVDARGWKVEDLVPRLERLITESRADLIAFDYLQEFQSKRRYQDERVKFKEIAKQLRDLGKRCKLPSILLSQLTLTEKTGVPTRQNIRECKDVANAADGILIGFEPAEDIIRNGQVVISGGTKCVLVDKCKDGARGMKVQLAWRAASASFQSVAEPANDYDLAADELDSLG